MAKRNNPTGGTLPQFTEIENHNAGTSGHVFGARPDAACDIGAPLGTMIAFGPVGRIGYTYGDSGDATGVGLLDARLDGGTFSQAVVEAGSERRVCDEDRSLSEGSGPFRVFARLSHRLGYSCIVRTPARNRLMTDGPLFDTRPVLTHDAVLAMLQNGVAKATEIGQPQCLVVVDASGEVMGSLRMTGAKYLSMLSATAKARTAASTGIATGGMPDEFAVKLAAATGNAVTNLLGGLPVKMGGQIAGAVGVGSGSGEQDVAVGEAMLASVGADAPG